MCALAWHHYLSRTTKGLPRRTIKSKSNWPCSSYLIGSRRSDGTVNLVSLVLLTGLSGLAELTGNIQSHRSETEIRRCERRRNHPCCRRTAEPSITVHTCLPYSGV